MTSSTPEAVTLVRSVDFIESEEATYTKKVLAEIESHSGKIKSLKDSEKELLRSLSKVKAVFESQVNKSTLSEEKILGKLNALLEKEPEITKPIIERIIHFFSSFTTKKEPIDQKHLQTRIAALDPDLAIAEVVEKETYFLLNFGTVDGIIKYILKSAREDERQFKTVDVAIKHAKKLGYKKITVRSK